MLAALQSHMGESRFEAASDEGRQMPIGATIDLVKPVARAGADAPEGLTMREVDVLALVAQGLTDAEVAERLVVSIRTVHAHLRSIYRKLDVRTRSAATRYAVEHDLVRRERAEAVAERSSSVTSADRRVSSRRSATLPGSTSSNGTTGRSDAVPRQRGEEIDHAGDGFFVAFPAPAAALACAVAIQQALADHGVTTASHHPFLIGVQQPTRSCGRRLPWQGSHIAARVGAVAEANEILASRETAERHE